jgi:hypothetical protein
MSQGTAGPGNPGRRYGTVERYSGAFGMTAHKMT